MTTSTSPVVRQIGRLIELLQRAGWSEAEVVADDVRLTVARAIATRPPDAAEPEGSESVLRAPSIGVVELGPVQVGDRVEAGHPVGVVRAWMGAYEIASEAGGRVGAIHAQSGDMVEFGQELLTLAAPDA